ncbi:formate dehydrogenase subunit gamma [Crenobacter sp. SG2305]|uniref:formate dehydrogenase subunit gamma n=1 Tax=Crenobacter oryzisoli TaxID=3056844 RepID=UPI0025AAF2FA|nr:formate dehydrogenase subunit gamma [Crenobacter sp. SG2305]MDN0082327.1 formate dehydrogenase subunit gamma [Crenobacter sp. SG2305]
MSREPLIVRYRAADRITHWLVALCFLLLALSGLGLFYPPLFWLTGVLGTGQTARILHPFIGVLMIVGFAHLFGRLWRDNRFDAEDRRWAGDLGSVLKGHEPGDTGRYNAGQKGLFWLMTLCLLLLLASGVVIWRPYFASAFPIPLIRLALLLHATMAILLIIGIIVHVYAAIWVKGTVRAMVEGVVTPAWAKKHHPRWYREQVGNAASSPTDKP